MVGGPALYTGQLRHRRFRPRPHAFTYNLFMAMVDIDHVAEQMTVSRLTSYNRFNWASFDDRDHLGDPRRPLRERLAESAAAAGLTLPRGPIYLLTHLRYLGHNFNPISFYYCYDERHVLRAVLNEVNSTFGEQRCYWIDATRARRAANGLHHRTAKTMHVSPFMTMAVDYEFVLTEPGESLVAHMNTFAHDTDTPRPYFDATLTLERREWSAANVRRALARHPLMTAKVVAAIHWQALRLWLKGVPHYAPPPQHPDAGSGRSTVSTEEHA
jgi:uncharacterized protein